MVIPESLGFTRGEYVNEPKSLEVKCKLARGDDGKVYWVPENIEELFKFLGAVQ